MSAAGWASALARARLPLFARELVAAANRRSTYRRRLTTLGGLFGLYCLLHLGLVETGGSSMQRSLGLGYIFDGVIFATCAVMVTLAVMQQCSGCIAAEKEGGTLPLLLLTPLGPRRLVAQKWLSQLVDAGTLALLALPLLAVGYALGGLGPAKVVAYVGALILLMLQAGGVGVLASSLAATVRGAGALALVFGLPFLIVPNLVAAVLSASAASGNGAAGLHQLAMLSSDLTPVGMLRMADAAGASQLAPPWLWWMAAWVVPLAPIAFMLEAASVAVGRWRETHAATDAQGRMRVEAGAPRGLPDAQGVAWLAWRQSFLGRPLSRLIIPLIVGLLLLSEVHGVGADPRAIALVLFLLAGFLLAISCGGMLPFERARQTLEVMLTTPCSAEGMVAQVALLNRRLLRWALAVLAIALAFALLGADGILAESERYRGNGPHTIFRCLASTLVILASMRNALALIIPCGLLVGAGLSSPSNARASTILHALFLLCLLPLLLFLLVMLASLVCGALGDETSPHQAWEGAAQGLCACISPLLLIFAGMYAPESHEEVVWFPLLLALPFAHAGLVALVQRHWLARAVDKLRLPALAREAA